MCGVSLKKISTSYPWEDLKGQGQCWERKSFEESWDQKFFFSSFKKGITTYAPSKLVDMQQ